MNIPTKDTVKSYLLRDNGFILKNNLKLHEEIFDELYTKLLEDKSQSYELNEIEDAYYEELLDNCEHDDYETFDDESPTSIDDKGNISYREYRYAICKYCGKISYPDSEGGFENWEIEDVW